MESMIARTSEKDSSASPFKRGVESMVGTAMLFGVFGIWLLKLAGPVVDPDLWWHLAAGRWITEHRTVPTVDPFGTGGQPQEWLNYSWSLDVLWWKGYEAVGLAAPIAYTALMAMALLLVCRALPQRNGSQMVRRSFAGAMGFTAITSCLSPRSFLVTMLFTGTVILFARRVRSGLDPKYGVALVPLFAIWPNAHIEFIYGLYFLGITIADRAVLAWKSHDPAAIQSLRRLCGVTLACSIATTLNPFGLRLHARVSKNIFSYGSYDLVSEMQPNSFRSVTDYLLLIAFAASVWTLAHKRDSGLYPWASLALAAYLSFHSQRAMWMVVFVSLDIIGDLPVLDGARRVAEKRWRRMLLPMLLSALVGLFIASAVSAPDRLLPTNRYPFAAVSFIRDQHLRGPLYNDWDWGGFCRFALPNIVGNADGRSCSPEVLKVVTDTWAAKPSWRSDSQLQNASFVLANAKSALSEVLRLDSRWRIAFEDTMAVVFVRMPR